MKKILIWVTSVILGLIVTLASGLVPSLIIGVRAGGLPLPWYSLGPIYPGAPEELKIFWFPLLINIFFWSMLVYFVFWVIRR